MLKLAQPRILNSKGEPIVLSKIEKAYAAYTQNLMNNHPIAQNALGYEIDITTLTTIVKKVSEQKFFEVPPAEYLPLVVGEGAWSSNLVTYRSYQAGDQFETGVLNMGIGNGRQASVSAGVDSLSIKVFNWAKSLDWNIMELEMAAKAGNWDIVSAKEQSRKENWDLGIQRIAFLGARGSNGASGDCVGLLNQSIVNVDTTTIPKALKDMTPAELKTFQEKVIESYRNNCNRTAWPTHFIIPESDYNGLTSQSSPTFPLKSTLQLLEEAFKLATRNPQFKILPLAYCDMAYSGFTYQQYVMLKYDEKSLRMNIPVDYTSTLANSLDNFTFQNSAYGQFTGVQIIRELETLYFQYTP